jgi:hypothetical protein
VWKCELETRGNRQVVDLGVAWSDALASHQPVFAYATLERRVQLSKDLAIYFENLLALGGAFNELDLEINSRMSQSRRDHDAWQSAFRDAQTALKEVDDDRARGDEADLDPVIAPAVDGDIEAWISSNELSIDGPTTGNVPTGAVHRLRTASLVFREARKELNDVGRSVADQLAGELEQLHAHALRIDNPGEACPVCETRAPQWREQLGHVVDRLDKLTKVRAGVAAALQSLVDEGGTCLQPVLDVDISPSEHPDAYEASVRGQSVHTALADSIASNGASLHIEVLDSAERLSEWIQSEEATELIDLAELQADRLRQWKLARAAVVVEFIDLWRATKDSASQAPRWKAVHSRVDDLRKRLRTKRTAILETRASSSVQDLLADVGLHIGDLVVQKTKATMQLLDANGKSLDLGMLSAGQRNAVLLAPLLASIEAGPFGFVVLDDPVHAFDQLRIDRLAKALGVLAADRRVIVLTHDERLREHIMARPVASETRLVTRSGVDGSVTVTNSDQFWSRLLKDAEIILDMGRRVSGTSLSVTDTVRGLCRQALDNAIRESVIRCAVLAGDDLGSWLEELDGRTTTRKRLDFAATVADPEGSVPHPALAALATCAPHMNDWNMASHGNPPLSEVSKVEIEAARKACLQLTGGTAGVSSP